MNEHERAASRFALRWSIPMFLSIFVNGVIVKFAIDYFRDVVEPRSLMDVSLLALASYLFLIVGVTLTAVVPQLLILTKLVLPKYNRIRSGASMVDRKPGA